MFYNLAWGYIGWLNQTKLAAGSKGLNPMNIDKYDEILHITEIVLLKSTSFQKLLKGTALYIYIYIYIYI